MLGRGRQRAERVPGQDRVAGREHRPDLHHQAVVVGEVADPAGVPAGAEVLHQVARPDDRLGLERHRGRRDPGQRVQRLGDRVHLGLVLAAGAHPLPEERDRVEPEHLDPEVGQPQDDLGELGQHRRVGPVEVPLPLVERRPDPALEVVVPGEVAGREVGEHLGQRPLVLRRAGRGRGRRGSSRGTASASPARARAAQSCSRATWLRTRSMTRLIPWPRSVVASSRRSSVVPRSGRTAR